MGHFELLSFESDAALAARAAGDWVKLVAEAQQQGKPHHVALSGGRITKRFFEAVAAKSDREGVAFSNAHFFWADERCVPPDDEESNFAVAERMLLQPLGVPSEQVHRIPGEIQPDRAARIAESDLRRVVDTTDHSVPVLDLVFLGMGEDGHVASLFPEEPQTIRDNSALFRAVTATKPPPQRVTMGYPVIFSALSVWVLVSGSGKKAALEKALSKSGQLPLGQVLSRRGRTIIYTDVER